MNDINMVPFIDVMLVLLIIFMVTAPLISPSVIDIPSVGKASVAPDQVITVEIGKNQHIEIRSRSNDPKGTDVKQSSTLEEVGPAVYQLQAGHANAPVVISADRTIAYETVVSTLDHLQKAGVQRVGLAVRLNP